jgi:predicted Zn-dependent protease
MSPGRVLLVVGALVATAWFALSVHQAVDTDRATALITSHASAAELRRAERLLDAAGTLNPDRSVDILRAQLDTDRGDLRGARRIIKRVVASEPDNLEAWLTLARASVHDLRDFYAAAFAIHHLIAPVHRAP